MEFRGYVIIFILSNSSRFAWSKASGPEVLNEKNLSLYVERIFSHLINSEQILKLVKLSEDSFPDLNTVYIRGQVPH